MLKQLYIRNLALVDELSIDFAAGLTVISGETGAGKSMLLDALGLALGDRLNPILISNNAHASQVVATFDITQPDHPALAWLEEHSLADGAQCLLRRSCTNSGNRCFINGVPVTQIQMGQLGDLLIELHGQHQHHSLLHQLGQVEMFDSYCQLGALSKQVSQLNHERKVLAQEIADLEASLQQANSDKAYISYQLEELELLAPREGEYQQLDQQQRQLGKQHQLEECITRTLHWIDGNDAADNLSGSLFRLNQLSKELTQFSLDACQSIVHIFDQIEIQLNEVSQQLQDMRHQDQLDKEQIYQLEQRLTQWHVLARKHHIDPPQLPSLLDDFRRKLAGCASHDDQLQQCRQRLLNIEQCYADMCAQLSQGRHAGVEEFSHRVTSLVRDLSMPDARFVVWLEEQEPGVQGNEKVHFLIQTNPGSQEAPMEKIVSGGELSRISLAIHQTCHEVQQYNRCMVFDEIDVGMSGAVAERIGHLLRTLGKDSQVICITHQPQVVARGHHHFLVRKKTKDQQATIDLQPLQHTGRVNEIARMLSGERTRDKSIDLAQQMYQLGQAG